MEEREVRDADGGVAVPGAPGRGAAVLLLLEGHGREGAVLSRSMTGSVLCRGCFIFIYFLFLAARGLPCHAQVSLGAASGSSSSLRARHLGAGASRSGACTLGVRAP